MYYFWLGIEAEQEHRKDQLSDYYGTEREFWDGTAPWGFQYD